MGAIKKAFVMTGRYRWINKDAEDVFTNQEVLTLVINRWGQKQGSYSNFLKYGGEQESVCIELAMMQLIHSRKALEPYQHVWELGIHLYSGRVIYHQRSNIFNQDKIASSSPS
jgi:hypothetical protein